MIGADIDRMARHITAVLPTVPIQVVTPDLSFARAAVDVARLHIPDRLQHRHSPALNKSHAFPNPHCAALQFGSQPTWTSAGQSDFNAILRKITPVQSSISPLTAKAPQLNDTATNPYPEAPEEDGTLELIDLGVIRMALAEAEAASAKDARAHDFVASLSALLLMHGQLALGNGLGALIGLKPLDAEALERLTATPADEPEAPPERPPHA
jgi:hypothetical protein